MPAEAVVVVAAAVAVEAAKLTPSSRSPNAAGATRRRFAIQYKTGAPSKDAPASLNRPRLLRIVP